MRRLFAMGCCALCLGFGFVAGVAHVHGSADHHEESRGLHFDHAHDHGHDPGPEGDAHDVDATALRSTGVNIRVTPVVLAFGPAIDPPAAMSDLGDAMPSRPRDPPQKIPPRLRAPPA